MKKTLIGLLALLMVSGFVALAQAAESENVIVRVTITSALDITLVSGSLIDFGEMDPDEGASISASSTTIKNSGSGINETYKMYATSPSEWTAGDTAGHNTYVLQAAFNDTLPTVGDFDTLDNELGEGSGNEKIASDTKLTIDASVTGASVGYGEDRTIWYEFQPPSTSSETGERNITVTITAIEG